MHYLLGGFMLLCSPLLTFAHTKWYATGDVTPLVSPPNSALHVGVLLGLVAFAIAVGIILERKQLLTLDFFHPKKPHSFERAASTFTMLMGVFLIIAGTHSYIFSPNLSFHTGVPMFFIVAQIIVGFSFLLGIMSRLAGIILMFLWILLFQFIEPLLLLENIWVLTTALFIMMMGNDYFSIFSFATLRTYAAPYKKYALSLLRLGTGVTLVILGFSEKILAPELGVNFLSQHHWNFMHHMGFEFSDYLFTLAAGSVELLFGIVFILGVVTRLNALVVAVVFFIPIFILGPMELAGHLPHFAAIILLLLFGNGGHFTIFRRQE